MAQATASHSSTRKCCLSLVHIFLNRTLVCMSIVMFSPKAQQHHPTHHDQAHNAIRTQDINIAHVAAILKYFYFNAILPPSQCRLSVNYLNILPFSHIHIKGSDSSGAFEIQSTKRLTAINL